jgi:RNA polymerase sigma-70 factor (ECF subfamily)
MPADVPHELEQHRALLLRLARELVRGEAAAEDLVQESFLRALERPPRSRAALRAWLAAVLRRLASNRGRSRRRADARERRAARPEAVPPPEEALASLELQEQLVAALKALAEPYRTTLWLRFHEALAPAEIAARLGASPRTIESRLARGLAQLRAELDRSAGGDRTRWLAGVVVLARGGRGGPASTLIGVAAMKKLVALVVPACVLGVAWRVGRVAPPDDGVRETIAVETDRPTQTTPAQGAPERLPVAPAPGPGANGASGTLRIDVRWSDGGPAPDVGLFVFADDDPLGARRVARTRTDATGTAVVADLHPGAVRVVADRGAWRSLEAAQGVETRVTLELDVGIDVEGTVADGSGAPVMDAEVLLVTEDENWLATRVVARTGIGGSFAARALPAEHSLSARGGSFAPARLVPLAGKASPGGVARVDLVLSAPALAVRGIVLDPSRRPVPHALVACGDPQGLFVSQAGTYYWAERGMAVVETGADGRFEARSILQTRTGLACAVLAEGFPVWSGAVGADLGETSFVEIVLVPPATVAGVVRDASGEPVAGARVHTIVGGDLRALDSPFPLPEGCSDAAGAYRLELAAPGPVVLRIDPPQGSSFGHALHADVLAPGTNERDLVLPADDVVRGRAEDWLGRPLIDRVVRVCAMSGSSRVEPRTDAQGRFAISGCDDPPYAVDLLDEAGRTPVISLTDVGPSSAEIVLRLSLPASLAGELAGAGMPGGDERAKVALEPRMGIHWPVPEWRDGRFVFENLQPGSYRVHARSDERLLARSEWIALAPGEHVDIGVLSGEAPGALVVELESWPATFGGCVRGRDLSVHASLDLGERGFGVEALAPGEWWLDVDGAGMAGALEPFTVRPDETTRVRVALEPGVARTLSFPCADPASNWNELTVRVRGRDGRLHLGAIRERGEGGGSVLVRLPPGTFTVEAETDTGLVARGSFDVRALEPQESALVFELR